MSPHIRVYYQNQCIVLCEQAQEIIVDLNLTQAHVVRARRVLCFQDLFVQFIDTPFTYLLIEGPLTQVLQRFRASFVCIQAGGGLLQNEVGAYLFIKRLGKWDLPKGKLDPGEDIATCATREVNEETGVSSIQLIDKLLDTYHIYFQNNEYLLKETSWYSMRAPMQTLVPQAEEDITAASWLQEEQIADALQNTYPNIRWLWEVYKFRKLP